MPVSITLLQKCLFLCLTIMASQGYCFVPGIDVRMMESEYKLEENSPEIHLEDKYLICDSQSLFLNAGNEGVGAVYKWENLTTGVVESTDRIFEVVKPGNYRLTVRVGEEVASKAFVVLESFTPTSNIATKTYTLCVGSVMTFDAGNPGADFLWINDNSGDTISRSQTATIAFKGKYTVVVITPCGTSVSAFLVDEIAYPDLKEVPAIGYLCEGDSVTIDAKNFDSRAVWMEIATGDTIATTKRITLGKLGDYELILYNQCDTVSKIVSVVPREAPQAGLEAEMFICDGVPVELDAGNEGASYEWVNVETKAVISNSQKIVVDKGGLYSVKVIDACGVVFDTVNVSKTKLPEVSLKNQYLICDGNADQITLNLFDVAVEWTREGEVISRALSFAPDVAGQYSLKVSNGCGTAAHDFEVVESFVPEIDIPSEVSLMALDGTTVLDAENEGASYEWTDVALGAVIGESQTVEISHSGQYILGVTTPCGGTVKVINVNLITAVDDESPETPFSVFPNPARGRFFVKSSNAGPGELTISLVDLAGRNILSVKSEGVRPGGTMEIDVSSVPKGLYILHISGEAHYKTKVLLR